jgi:hypothetical protein
VQAVHATKAVLPTQPPPTGEADTIKSIEQFTGSQEKAEFLKGLYGDRDKDSRITQVKLDQTPDKVALLNLAAQTLNTTNVLVWQVKLPPAAEPSSPRTVGYVLAKKYTPDLYRLIAPHVSPAGQETWVKIEEQNYSGSSGRRP